MRRRLLSPTASRLGDANTVGDAYGVFAVCQRMNEDNFTHKKMGYKIRCATWRTQTNRTLHSSPTCTNVPVCGT